MTSIYHEFSEIDMERLRNYITDRNHTPSSSNYPRFRHEYQNKPTKRDYTSEGDKIEFVRIEDTAWNIPDHMRDVTKDKIEIENPRMTFKDLELKLKLDPNFNDLFKNENELIDPEEEREVGEDQSNLPLFDPKDLDV